MSDHAPISPSDLAVDHALARLSTSVPFLLDVTPIDTDDVWAEFTDRPVDEPRFHYRELHEDTTVLRAELDEIDLNAIDDPTLAHLLRSKHREVRLQLDMLEARNTPQFLPLSIELYGAVAPDLLDQAESLLREVPANQQRVGRVGANEFLVRVEEELAIYRSIDADISVHAEIRPDTTGVMVSGDTVLIGKSLDISSRRVEALLNHEVGTHLVTYVNGSRQPIQTLSCGLAGYDETQEGLAVLAEIAVGGLTPFRLRQLAGRVIAVHLAVEGVAFRETHEVLVEAGFSPRSAFGICMRTYRSGGLTKDAIYLRGLVDLLDHLRDGGSLDLLFVGKLSLEDLPLVADLVDRGTLDRPGLLPRYLEDTAARDRIQKATLAESLTELLEIEP